MWPRFASCFALVACGSGGGFPDAKIDGPPLPGGSFSIAWSLEDMAAAPLTCGEVGGITVTLLLRNLEVMGGTTEVLSCNTGMGKTGPVVPGTYDVGFELSGAAGLIATAPLQQGLEVVSEQDTPLTPIKFRIDPTGALELFFTANTMMGNCVPTGMMGAGITNTTITIDRMGTCQPVRFDIAAGTMSGAPASQYMVSCGTPTLGPCIETDQKVTVMGLRSGDHVIHIKGKRGGNDCYLNDDTLPVPAANLKLVRTLNLAPQMTPGC
jgi:hypothetical protein